MSTQYPQIRNGSSWDSLIIFSRRTEERLRQILGQFTKLSLNINRQQHRSGSSAQDLGYWEQELQRFERDYTIAMTIYYTLTLYMMYYPKSIPGQEQEQYIVYIPYDVQTTRFPQFPQSGVAAAAGGDTPGDGGEEQQQDEDEDNNASQQQVHKQYVATQRNIATFNDFARGFALQSESYCNGLNALRLFSGQDLFEEEEEEENGRFDDDDDEEEESGSTGGEDENDDDEQNMNIPNADGAEGSDLDIESGLLHVTTSNIVINNNNNHNHNNKSNNKSKRKRKKKSQNTKAITTALHNERQLIGQALAIADTALAHGAATLTSFDRQREVWNNITSTVSTSIRSLFSTTDTISAIQQRQRRDNCILATLVAFLLCFTIIYIMMKHDL